MNLPDPDTVLWKQYVTEAFRVQFAALPKPAEPGPEGEDE